MKIYIAVKLPAQKWRCRKWQTGTICIIDFENRSTSITSQSFVCNIFFFWGGGYHSYSLGNRLTPLRKKVPSGNPTHKLPEENLILNSWNFLRVDDDPFLLPAWFWPHWSHPHDGLIIMMMTLLPCEIHGNVSWRSVITTKSTVRLTEQICI